MPDPPASVARISKPSSRQKASINNKYLAGLSSHKRLSKPRRNPTRRSQNVCWWTHDSSVIPPLICYTQSDVFISQRSAPSLSSEGTQYWRSTFKIGTYSSVAIFTTTKVSINMTSFMFQPCTLIIGPRTRNISSPEMLSASPALLYAMLGSTPSKHLKCKACFVLPS